MSTGLENSLVTPSRIERLSVGENGTQGNNYSRYQSISEDGRYITFNSSVSNLVEGDTNGVSDVFVVENPLFNNPPIVHTEIPNQITNNTDTFSLDVSSNFKDADGIEQLSFSATGLPEGLSISAEGMISGQTQGNGSYTVGITAEDLTASAQSYFNLNEDRLELSTDFTGSLGLSESDGNTTISIVGEQGEKAIALLQGVTDADLASLGLGIK